MTESRREIQRLMRRVEELEAVEKNMNEELVRLKASEREHLIELKVLKQEVVDAVGRVEGLDERREKVVDALRKPSSN